MRLHDRRAAWEVARRGRISHVDLSSQGINGGVFDRTRTALSWVSSPSLRLVLDYGQGVLRGGGSAGHSQFLTARVCVHWELR